MNIRVALQFYPNQANPARPSGKGVYRVAKCWHTGNPNPIRVFPAPKRDCNRLYMQVSREFKPGSRIDPVKAALDYVRVGRYHAHLSFVPGSGIDPLA